MCRLSFSPQNFTIHPLIGILRQINSLMNLTADPLRGLLAVIFGEEPAMNDSASIDQLFVLSVSTETLMRLREQLVKRNFVFTQIESSGGIIQKESVCLLVGISSGRADELMKIIRKSCKRHRTFIPARMETSLISGAPMMLEVEVGGALVYVLEVERFEQF